jgi:membrane-associated phospholipid phosphatase
MDVVNEPVTAIVEPAASLGDLHRSPPITLRAVRERVPWLFPAAVAVAVVLGVLAAVGAGRWLVWDPPITRVAIGLRTPSVDRVAVWVSRLGSTPVVLIAGMAGVLLAARRCRSVAVVMLIAVAVRPPFEWLVKELVARPRPSGARLVPGDGFAYPSGHVLAAAATWGFVPVIAALYTRRRWVWWTLTTLTLAVIGLVAWCRVWLGVHWTSDVVGALAIAFVALSTAEAALDRWHQQHTPSNDPRDESRAGPAEEISRPSQSRGT